MRAQLKAESTFAGVPKPETAVSLRVSTRRIPELDGLRGLAILLVLVWHFGYLFASAGSSRWLYYVKDSMTMFWSGVDLFFVLSGFLIGGILLDARESPNYFKTFYTRRSFRIIPVYALLVVTFYVCVSLGLPARIAGSSAVFGATAPWYEYATFTQNIGYATGQPSQSLWLSTTWSLAVEEQFYLLLPAVVYFVPRRRLLYVIGCGIVAAPLSRLFLNLYYSHGKDASFNLMPCRADALLLGVASALLVRSPSGWEFMKAHRRWLVGVWSVLLAGLPLFIVAKQTDPVRSFWMSTAGISWVALFYAGMLLLGLIYSQSWPGQILRNSWLKSLGTISYGVYLYHAPIISMAFALFRHKSPWAIDSGERVLSLLSLAASLAIASLSWSLLEKPLLKIGHNAKY